MKFYTIYLSAINPIYDELTNAIHDLNSLVYVTKSPYIELTLNSKLRKTKTEQYDLPLDRHALYVNCCNEQDYFGQIRKDIHSFLQQTNEYFVLNFTNIKYLMSTDEIRSLARKIVTVLNDLNDKNIWTGNV